MNQSRLPILSGDDVSSNGQRSRYYEFLNQQQQKTVRRSPPPKPTFSFAQGLLSLTIFVLLFLAIVTLFGFSLMQLGGH